ncbi:MAG: AAA family ATPase [Verrucomicrobiae bacterium]|nr:AAA family ATPase [Verrucomicrobiae bacterium]MDW8308674.1 AAA family ATPase [Verrucomicrobiales bacterium]
MILRRKKNAISDADIMMYLALALKHLRLMVLLFAFALTLGLVYYCYARPVYHSKALVRYHTLEQPLDTEKVFRDASDRAVLRELRAPHIMVRTARRLGIQATERELMKKYIKKIRVEFDSERNIIIEIWPYSHALARDWAETMVQEYLQHRDERRAERMRKTWQQFTNDMQELRLRMDAVFNEKFDFRDSNELTRILIDLNRLKEVPRQLYTVKHQLAIMDQTREALQTPGRDTVSKLSLLAAMDRDLEETQLSARQIIPQVNIGAIVPKDDSANGVVVQPYMISSPNQKPWEELDRERRRLQQLAQDLGRTYLPRHPKMLDVQKRLDAVNRSLELELDAAMSRFNLQYAALVDKAAQLEQKLPEYDQLTRRYQRYQQEYAHFDSGQLAWNKMYDEMSRRLNALDFGAERERAELQFMELLEIRDQPVSPNRLKLVIYFSLLGLALAIAIPFFIEYVDSRVSDVDQVEETLRLRGLGVVPKLVESPMEELLLPHAKPDHHVTENFRLIRTNLIMNADSPGLPQVIVVTSAMPQEGKTVVAAHLAMSFARKGERTLLVDADLRRGRLHRLFGYPNRPGLSEVLAGQHPLESAFRPVHSNGNGHSADTSGASESALIPPNGNGHLTLLTCGKHMQWASELLDSQAFPKLISELRQRFDRIIVDTPPVLGLSETAIIQRSADGVVLVIWSEYTAMRNVKTAIQMLQTNGAKFAGFILNRLDFTALTNRYRYFYYSPYYYRSYKAIPPSAESVS